MFIVSNTFHPRTWPALLPLLAAGAVLYMGQTQAEVQSMHWIAVLLVVLAVAIWYFLSQSEITIDDLGITSSNIFRTRHVLWQNVSSTFIKYQHQGKSGSHYWHFESRTDKPMRFSIGLYSRSNLRQIAEAVVQKCGTAEIQPRIRSMAEGDFPWYMV